MPRSAPDFQMPRPIATASALLFLWFAAPTFGQGPAEAPAAGELARPTIVADVVYGHKAGMALTYDVIRPANQNGAGVLYMVSGGWGSHWFPPEEVAEDRGRGRGLFAQLLRRGYVVYLVRHGSSPYFKVPDAVADVRRAVRHVRLNAAAHGVDPNRLGVTGASAGGHLSLMLGTAADAPDRRGPRARRPDDVDRASGRVAAVVALFPPTDLREIVGRNERFKALDFPRDRAAEVSPVLFATADDAPTLLIHGDRDRLVPPVSSERMRDALKDAGVRAKLVVIEGAAHGFRGEDGDRAAGLTAGWFDTHLAAPAAATSAGR